MTYSSVKIDTTSEKTSNLQHILPVSIPNSSTTKSNRWKFLRSPLFLTVVAVPNFIALTYWGLIASPVYQSDAIVIVTNPNKDSDSLTSLLAGNAGASTSGAWILKNRLLSWDEFKSIDTKFHIAETYRHGDFVARAGGLSSFWRSDDIALWHYYQSMVGITIDEQTGITQVNVKGWNSKDAYEISKTLIQDGITHLNHLNEEEDNDFISSATKESDRLQKQLAEDEHAISQWRSQHGYLSPVSDYTSSRSRPFSSIPNILNSTASISRLSETHRAILLRLLSRRR